MTGAVPTPSSALTLWVTSGAHADADADDACRSCTAGRDAASTVMPYSVASGGTAAAKTACGSRCASICASVHLAMCPRTDVRSSRAYASKSTIVVRLPLVRTPAHRLALAMYSRGPR